MKRTTLGWTAALVLVVGGAALVWVLFLAGGSGEPSTDLTTPEMAVTTTRSAVSSTVGSVGAPGSMSPAPEASQDMAFVIDPSQSVAVFELDEVLRGEPKTVVGTTDQVAGQVLVVANDLGASVFSDIVINARTLSTDSEQRNRAMRGPVVLDSGSDEHELITFTPTTLDGLDGVQPAVGESYRFTVEGELTIKGTTAPATFEVTVEMLDEGSIAGVATTQVLRSEFGIGIPSVPFVADVSDEVLLTLEFVATTS